jgi:chromosome segregation ATPase
LRLNERQAAEIQRAIAAADDADAANCVMRAQMEKLRLQMETQGIELSAAKHQLEEKIEQLVGQQRGAGERVLELQSQRDAMAKALRQSRLEADAAASEALVCSARAEAVEAALASMREQVAEYESSKQSLQLQQQALLQQQEELNRRERVADESCRRFASARTESQAAVAALKLELSACNAQLQTAQGQLSMMGGSQGALEQFENLHRRLKHRGRSIAKVLSVSCCDYCTACRAVAATCDLKLCMRSFNLSVILLFAAELEPHSVICKFCSVGQVPTPAALSVFIFCC